MVNDDSQYDCDHRMTGIMGSYSPVWSLPAAREAGCNLGVPTLVNALISPDTNQGGLNLTY